jgi:hypothetical protein
MDARVPMEIRPLLHGYVRRLQEDWSGIVTGCYLYGSIALGEYVSGKSDIDFLAVTSRPLTSPETNRLARLHDELNLDYACAASLDGVYLPFSDLGKTNQEISPYPYCKRGILEPSGYWDVNHVTWWLVKHRGIALFGSPPSQLPFTVTWEHVLTTMQENLASYWAEKAAAPHLLLSDEAAEFALCTMARILYTLQHRTIVSKHEALHAVDHAASPEWEKLRREAMRIRTGSGAPSLFATKEERAEAVSRFLSRAIAWSIHHVWQGGMDGETDIH